MAISCFELREVLRYHQAIVADRDRVERYRSAIHEVVQPGDVVVDIGTGTGLLAYFACQAGAARVYGIERGPIVRVAEEMRRVNGFEDRVVFLIGESSRIEVPEPADVLISEILWNFGLGEGIMGTILDARERFLKPGGRVLPLAFDMVAAPAEFPEPYRRIAFEPEDDYGLDFSVLRTYAPSNIYATRVPDSALLSEPVTLQSFDLTGDPPRDASGSATAEITRSGTFHGVAGWFSTQLSPSITLSNAPRVASSWVQVFMPVAPTAEVAAGARIGIRVQTSANGSVWRWTTDVSGPDDGSDVRSMDATTFFGFPFDPEFAGGRAGGLSP